MRTIRLLSCLAMMLVCVTGLLGCATNKLDWASRVGNYTYDQAITEMGPPERSARLTDGSTVADWLERRGLRTGFVAGGVGYHHPYASGFYGPTVVTETAGPDSVLRLTFDKDGKLVTWKKVLR